ncbi:FUSC family membrane protein [Sodalis sp.]|uniref:FUSC family membrane protein n=1 Tax=Sodalis sp. (in: enterobacteria) TaxID=1898979 RepID=UPI00387370E4
MLAVRHELYFPGLFGVSGEIRLLHDRLLPALLIAAVSTLGLTGNVPLWPPLLYLAGSAWYGLFDALWFRLWHEVQLANSAHRRTVRCRRCSPVRKAINQIAQVYWQLNMLSPTISTTQKTVAGLPGRVGFAISR